MKIELTIEQANALLNVLDVAVRAEGLKLASTALFFHGAVVNAAKLEEAEAAAQKSNSPTVDTSNLI